MMEYLSKGCDKPAHEVQHCRLCLWSRPPRVERICAVCSEIVEPISLYPPAAVGQACEPRTVRVPGKNVVPNLDRLRWLHVLRVEHTRDARIAGTGDDRHVPLSAGVNCLHPVVYLEGFALYGARSRQLIRNYLNKSNTSVAFCSLHMEYREENQQHTAYGRIILELQPTSSRHEHTGPTERQVLIVSHAWIRTATVVLFTADSILSGAADLSDFHQASHPS